MDDRAAETPHPERAGELLSTPPPGAALRAPSEELPTTPASSAADETPPDETPSPGAALETAVSSMDPQDIFDALDVGDTLDDPLIGQTLADRYLIKDALGAGAMGAVYVGEHVMMGKTVAIKVLHEDMSRDPEIVARFQREARAAAAIDHPNICAATDFGRTAQGAFFLVMEHLDGQTLHEALGERGRISEARTIHIADQVCAVLEQAHALGIIHRDLKPENIMIVRQGDEADVVKVMDFGIASMRMDGDSKEDRLTRAGVAYGTPAYMSPEQVVGDIVDHRADLYALGVLLFEMITGQVPYFSESVSKIMGKHLTAPIPSIRERAPDVEVHDELVALVESLLAKEREDRPQSAADVRARLAAISDPSAALPPHRLDRQQLRRMSATTPGGIGGVADTLSVSLNTLRLSVGKLQRQHGPAFWGAILVGGAIVLALGGVLGLSMRGPTDRAAARKSAKKQVNQTLRQERDAFLDEDGMRLALEATARGDGAKALELLSARATKFKDNAHFHYYMGMAHRTKEQWPEMLTSYEQAIKLDPRYRDDEGIFSDVTARLNARKDEDAQPAIDLLKAQLAAAHPEALAALAEDEQKTRAQKRALSVLRDTKLFDKLPRWRQLDIELLHAHGCQPHRDVIDKMVALKDPKNLKILKKYSAKPKSGCGRWIKNQDCIGCIRDDLASAIKALEPLAPKADGVKADDAKK